MNQHTEESDVRMIWYYVLIGIHMRRLDRLAARLNKPETLKENRP